MSAVLLLIGAIVALGIICIGEMLIQAWYDNDELRKEIDHLKRQGITPRKFETKGKTNSTVAESTADIGNN